MSERELVIDAAGVQLEGILQLPANTRGLVLFAHGSGSSRFSPRNRMVAGELNRAGMGTLLFDLLTAEEHQEDEITREYRFDIALLSDRLIAAMDWVHARDDTRDLKLGLFGSSTGAAAALIAAAERPALAAAVVSRGGRPDLAREMLPLVRAPTLLVVGGEDDVVIDLNRDAAARMTCDPVLEIVPGATHLFEEPGTLEQVIGLAIDWFRRHLAGPGSHGAD
ncbi:dienelactone hydrolase family protein [Microbulbifer yueqingensis]|uniref:Dienelactone hydrolase n=1 Tax=Microbulbifer yueqingensis TaxID=658219 RepID=A0A1G9BZ52_9GAMM|nr:alpha/beta family hydrolase [Microbulbifer yueqingensis]SDK44732.1 Dienelactone hydrolase [Microbulbifer yueqingensis]